MIEKDINVVGRITADQARAISRAAIDYLPEAYQAIRSAIDKGLVSGTEVILRGPFWADEGYTSSGRYKEACDVLRSDGYVVEFFYDCRQFVDMGTLIRW